MNCPMLSLACLLVSVAADCAVFEHSRILTYYHLLTSLQCHQTMCQRGGGGRGREGKGGREGGRERERGGRELE